MKPKILKPTQENISLMGEQIAKGEVVCFKTDTIYGLATNPFSDDAVKKIFEAKQRPEDKPIILLASQNFDIESIAVLTEKEKEIVNKFWPAPLTIIFNLKPNHGLSKFVTCGQNIIAIRKPADALSNVLALQAGGLITSTSANISGNEVKNNAQDIQKEFENTSLKFILDGGKTQDITSSTLIKIENEQIKILRQGNFKVWWKSNFFV